MDKFTEAYIECALWSSGEYFDRNGKPCDDDGDGAEYRNYDHVDADLADEAIAAMERDCKEFQEQNGDDIEQCLSYAQAGHDFWLTRNGHGAGFWDRGLGDAGDRLTNAAHSYGSCDLYLGDDGKIYVS